MILHPQRKLCLFMALCLFLTLLPAFPSALADTPGLGYVNYNKVYFRKTPSTAANAEYWGFLDYNWPVTILSGAFNTYGSWYEVEAALPTDTSRVVRGYIMQRYVTVTVPPVTAAPTAVPTPTPAGSQLGYINTDKVYFRRDAGYRTDTWAILPLDWPVLVTGFTIVSGVKWIAVTASLPDDPATAYSGYVHSSFVSMGTPPVSTATAAPTPTSAPEPTPAATPEPDPLDGFSGYAMVTSDGTNVRLTANPSSASITALAAGQIVAVLGGIGTDTLNIRVQVVDGYVSADSLTLLSMKEYMLLLDPSYTPEATIAPPETLVPAETAVPGDPTLPPSPEGSDFSGFAAVVTDGAGIRLAADPAFLSFTSLLSGQLVTVKEVCGNGMVHIAVQALEGYMLREDLSLLTWDEYRLMTGQSAPEDPTPTPTAAVTAAPSPTPTATPYVPAVTPAATPAYQILGYIQLIKGGVNLRKSPGGASLNPTLETQLNMYSYLPYLQQPVFSGGYYWIYVYSPELNQYGYIRSDCYQFVKSTPTPKPSSDPAAAQGLVVTGYLRLTASNVNLRETPNGKSLTPLDTDRIYLSTPIAYYGNPVSAGGYQWARIEYNGMIGYIRSDCYVILASTDTPAPTATPEPVLQGYIVLTSDNVNIRKTPRGTVLAQAKIKSIFPFYGEVTYNGEVWYMIYHQGKKTYAYVLASMATEYTYVTAPPSYETAVPSATPAPTNAYITLPPAVTPTPAAAYGYVITTAQKVYIRLSASANSAALTLVDDAGTVLMLTGSRVETGNTAWYPVLYNGFNGYISAAFSRELSPWQAQIYLSTGVVPTPSPVPAQTDGLSDRLMVTTDKVFIRRGNGYSFPAEAQLANKGDVFQFYGTENDAAGLTNVIWYRIAYEDGVRYIHGGFVRVMTEEEYASYLETQLPQTPAPTASPAPETAVPSPTPSLTPAPSFPPENTPDPGAQEEITVFVPETFRLMSLDSTGDDVNELQKALYLQNYLDREDITGTFNASTQSAVIAYQLDFGLLVTGFVDEETWTAVFSPFMTID